MDMDFENITEEFVNEVNYCNYIHRRRTVSETEPQTLLPPDLFRQTSERSSAKTRLSQSTSPPRQAATANNGCMSPGDTSVNEGYQPRSAGRSRKIGELLGGGQNRRQFAADDQDVEMGEPLTPAPEFRHRAGSHGIRDLLRIRPRCNSHSEKHSDTGSPAVTTARGGGASGGNVTPLSPGTASGSASSSGSSSVSRFRVFLDAFRHRANSDSVSSPHVQFHGGS